MTQIIQLVVSFSADAEEGKMEIIRCDKCGVEVKVKKCHAKLLIEPKGFQFLFGWRTKYELCPKCMYEIFEMLRGGAEQ